MALSEPIMEPSIEIEAICYCGEKTKLYFPCSDRVAQEQMRWLFEHLADHKAVYHEAPFSLDITPIVDPSKYPPDEGTDEQD